MSARVGVVFHLDVCGQLIVRRSIYKDGCVNERLNRSFKKFSFH